MAKAVSVKAKSEVLASLEGVFAEARAEFEANSTEELSAWRKELERLKEEDLYAFNKTKRDREDALDVQLKTRLASVVVREEDAKAREKAAYEAEVELNNLREAVANIPSEVSAAESKGFHKGVSSTQKEAEANSRISAAEVLADKRVYAGQLENLRSTLTQYEATIASLRDELADSNKRVSDIATASVNAAGQQKFTVNTTATK